MNHRNEDSRVTEPPAPPVPPRKGPPAPSAAPRPTAGPPPLPTASEAALDPPEVTPVAAPSVETPEGSRWKNPPPATVPPEADSGQAESEVEVETPLWRQWLDQAVDASPPWLVSFVFHLAVLIVLALLTIAEPAVSTVMLVLDPSLATEEGLDDDDLQTEMIEPDIEMPELALDELAVDEPLADLPEVEIDLSGLAAAADIQATSIGAALTGREAGNKQALLAKYGGTRVTEEAVALALGWLKRQQRSDGTWSLTGPYSNGGFPENRVAATAMALLAFQGAGITPQTGKYKAEVAKGARALLSMQQRDGFFKWPSGSQHHQLYAHAQAMIAICELYGMTKNPKYKKPAEKAVQFAVRSQTPQGGWRYQIGVDADLSVTGWFLMGLQSARMAGLEVPKETLYRISEFLDSLQTSGGSRYRYRRGEGGATPSMTAEGLLCRQYLGWEQDDPRLVRGVRTLVARRIDYRGGSPDVYYWYYATQVCHHQGGEAWERWNAAMRERVPHAQVKVGKEKGSWDPRRDAWGNLGGRLYTTCLSTYMLEVYYRHLPIYSYRKKK